MRTTLSTPTGGNGLAAAKAGWPVRASRGSSLTRAARRNAMRLITRFVAACWELYARAFSFVASSALSNRGLTLTLFAVCFLLITGPWLRSSVSRDFRGVHIPWNNLASSRFLPEYVAEAPRDWR